MAFIFVQKQKEIFWEKKKKMTGFQQKAWLSNDKKERKKMGWNCFRRSTYVYFHKYVFVFI